MAKFGSEMRSSTSVVLLFLALAHTPAPGSDVPLQQDVVEIGRSDDRESPSAEDQAFKSEHLAGLRGSDCAPGQSRRQIWLRMLELAADFDDQEIIDRVFELRLETDGVAATQYALDLYELLERDPLFVVRAAHRYFHGDFTTLLSIWINEGFDVLLEDLLRATRPVEDDPMVREFRGEARRLNAELWESSGARESP